MAEYVAYLMIDGIKGDSQDLGFPDAIKLMSYSWDKTNGPNPQFKFTKLHDLTSPKLFHYYSNGLSIKKVTLVLVMYEGGNKKGAEYYRIEFTNVALTSFQAQSKDESAYDTATFECDKMVFTKYGEAPVNGTPDRAMWDTPMYHSI